MSSQVLNNNVDTEDENWVIEGASVWLCKYDSFYQDNTYRGPYIITKVYKNGNFTISETGPQQWKSFGDNCASKTGQKSGIGYSRTKILCVPDSEEVRQKYKQHEIFIERKKIINELTRKLDNMKKDNISSASVSFLHCIEIMIDEMNEIEMDEMETEMKTEEDKKT